MKLHCAVRRLSLTRNIKWLVRLILLLMRRIIALSKARNYFGKEKVYLFLPINGAGLGHLNRCLSVASALKKQEPDAEIIFLTTSIALPIVHRFGFPCHHVTPAALAGKEVATYEWNQLFANTIVEVMSIYRPRVLVFDGSYPYAGLQKVITSYKSKLSLIWIKRELYKSSVDTGRLGEQLRLFDSVISPAEISVAAERLPNSSQSSNENHLYHVSPIYLLEPYEILTRTEARETLDLEPSTKSAFVQLGAGNINDIKGMQDIVVAVLRDIGFKVVVARSPISLGEVSSVTGAHRVIVDFPTSRLMNAFDLAVVAGGYNSVCESVIYDVPTVFIPNLSTGSDDQLIRVESVARLGRFEVLADFDRYEFLALVHRMTYKTQQGIQEQNSIQFKNGADEAARIIRMLRIPRPSGLGPSVFTKSKSRKNASSD